MASMLLDSNQLEQLRHANETAFDAAKQSGKHSRGEARKHLSNLTGALLKHAGIALNGEQVPEAVHQQRRQAWEGLREHGRRVLGALAIAGATYATIRLVDALHHPQEPEAATPPQTPEEATNVTPDAAHTEPPLTPTAPISYQRPLDDEAFFVRSREEPKFI